MTQASEEAKILCAGCFAGLEVHDTNADGPVHRANLGGITEVYSCAATDPDDYEREVMDRAKVVLDRVSRERTRQALERAAEEIREKAESLHRWMLTFPIGSEERKDKSLRAGELFTAVRLVRALLSDGESVASEEKEG